MRDDLADHVGMLGGVTWQVNRGDLHRGGIIALYFAPTQGLPKL